MMFALAAVLTLCGVCPLALAVPPVWTQPEQIHIAYPGHPSSMVVTWVTQNKTASVVEYGVMGGKRFEFTAKGEATVFQDGGSEKRTMFMHTVILKGLKPAVSYVYHCGSDSGWSDLFYFRAMQEGVHWSPRVALFGDMGNENPQSLARLQKDTQVNMYDAILHIGDFAYDMNEDNARIGDEFMRQVESIAAYVPYMTCPGNHENAYNFSNYRYRFSMPGNTESLWYSWNIGPVHVISFSTEVYFYTEYGMDLLFRQYQWLQKDLEEASRPENRAQRPWIITMGHRPMYCSNRDGDDCTLFNSKVRTGFKDNSTVAPGLEDLFYSHGVDLMVWAHEHSYERLWPMYNYTIYNGSRHEPYTNPKAPVHIITGSAGCRERTDPFDPHYRPWSAYRSSDYGYARMQVFNSSHLYLEQVSDDQYGKTIDSMWLIKDKHGPEAWL